jgi:hypothetical protein
MAAKSRIARKTAVKRRASTKLHFIESMECLPVGYRLEVIKEPGDTRLYSRRGNLLTDTSSLIS